MKIIGIDPGLSGGIAVLENNQVLSILDIEKQELAISMLMRAFVFKKDLMYEHFNESYIESAEGKLFNGAKVTIQ